MVSPNKSSPSYDLAPREGYDFIRTIDASPPNTRYSIQRHRGTKRVVLAKTYVAVSQPQTNDEEFLQRQSSDPRNRKKTAPNEFLAYRDWLKVDPKHVCGSKCRGHAIKGGIPKCFDLLVGLPKRGERTVVVEIPNGGNTSELFEALIKDQVYLSDLDIWSFLNSMLITLSELHSSGVVYRLDNLVGDQVAFNVLPGNLGYQVILAELHWAQKPSEKEFEELRAKDLYALGQVIRMLLVMPAIEKSRPRIPDIDILYWVRRCMGEDGNFPEWDYSYPTTAQLGVPSIQDIWELQHTQFKSYASNYTYNPSHDKAAEDWLHKYFHAKRDGFQRRVKTGSSSVSPETVDQKDEGEPEAQEIEPNLNSQNADLLLQRLSNETATPKSKVKTPLVFSPGSSLKGSRADPQSRSSRLPPNTNWNRKSGPFGSIDPEVRANSLSNAYRIPQYQLPHKQPRGGNDPELDISVEERSKYLNTILSLLVGNDIDIANLDVDAIVTPSSKHFDGSGPSFLDRHIRDAAGPSVASELQGVKVQGHGRVIATNGFSLPSAFLLHTSLPSYNKQDLGDHLPDEIESHLKQCVELALRATSTLKSESVAFPALYPLYSSLSKMRRQEIRALKKRSFKLVLEAIRVWLVAHWPNAGGLKKIYFVINGMEDWEAFQSVVGSVFPPGQDDNLLRSATDSHSGLVIVDSGHEDPGTLAALPKILPKVSASLASSKRKVSDPPATLGGSTQPTKRSKQLELPETSATSENESRQIIPEEELESASPEPSETLQISNMINAELTDGQFVRHLEDNFDLKPLNRWSYLWENRTLEDQISVFTWFQESLKGRLDDAMANGDIQARVWFLWKDALDRRLALLRSKETQRMLTRLLKRFGMDNAEEERVDDYVNYEVAAEKEN